MYGESKPIKDKFEISKNSYMRVDPAVLKYPFEANGTVKNDIQQGILNTFGDTYGNAYFFEEKIENITPGIGNGPVIILLPNGDVEPF